MDLFEVKIISKEDNRMAEKYYNLYLNVKQRSLEINTFTLPLSYFENIIQNNKWEIIELYIKQQEGINPNEPIGIGLCYNGENDFAFPIVGLNYDVNYDYNCDRQILW